ncbi:MAG TPA: GtrA family protein [Caulobacteraceae bacterium]|nr:GtrA family protein [Caulobacteraceae bacterium]
MREHVGLVARFGLVGLINTAIGFAVVVALDPGLHVAPAIANAVGYLVGVAVGFILNRDFVFRSSRGLTASGARYAIAALGAFVLNQGVLRLAGTAFGLGAVQHIAAQLCAMATYSVVFFLACRFWVFRPGAASTAA